MTNSDIIYHPNTSRITYDIIEGEVIIVDFEIGVYYSINVLGSVIFNWLAQDVKLGNILSAIKKHYGSTDTDVDKAVNSFIDTLLNEAIIVRDDNENDDGLATGSISSLKGLPETDTFEAPLLDKYTDMQDLLLLDPIHEVDEEGWPFTQQDDA